MSEEAEEQASDGEEQENKETSEELPNDLESIISKLSDGPESLSEQDKKDITEVLGKYFSNGEIELEAVCNANGGRSPAMQVLLQDLINQYGVQEYFTITSSGSKLDKVRTRNLPGAFKLKIIKKGYKFNEKEPFLTDDEKKEVEYILSRVKEAGDNKDKINEIYNSDSKLKEIVDRLDVRCIRVMHIAEAHKRDDVLKDMGLYDLLLKHYYKEDIPPEIFPDFYRNRHQTEASQNKIYIAAVESNEKEIKEICKKAGISNPSIYTIGIEDAVGGKKDDYRQTYLQIKDELASLLPAMIRDYAANKGLMQKVAPLQTISVGYCTKDHYEKQKMPIAA